MGTRSRIGIMKKDGSITSIYCHWDGYLEHNGTALALHYNTPENVEKLIALGDISYLGNTLSTTESYNQMRGEDIVITHHNNFDEFAKHCFDSWEEYAYLYKDYEWLYCENDFDTKQRTFKPLKPKLEKMGILTSTLKERIIEKLELELNSSDIDDIYSEYGEDVSNAYVNGLKKAIAIIKECD